MTKARTTMTVRLALAALGVAVILGFVYVVHRMQATRIVEAPVVECPVVMASGLTHVGSRVAPALTEAQIRAADLSMREAMYYKKMAGGKVRCTLCPNLCLLAEGERGSCRVRANIGGKLRTLVYGRVVATHDDPIEKKPLFHYLPGTRSFSIATAGCNLGCIFCQNWEISQAFPEKAYHQTVTPEQVVATAKRRGCKTIAYTYTEPTIFYEFMLDCAKLAHKEGLKNVWVTCGYINPEPLRELCKVMDAANIDLKGYSEEFYNEYCGASLEPVLTTLKITKEAGVWVEVTNLVIPGANDDEKTIREMCRWYMKNLGPDVPLHFSRFSPKYRMRHASYTPPATLEMAARIARDAGIRYVYIGNMPTESGEDTFCPYCKRRLVNRVRYLIAENKIKNGCCPYCGKKIPGVWQLPPAKPAKKPSAPTDATKTVPKPREGRAAE